MQGQGLETLHPSPHRDLVLHKPFPPEDSLSTCRGRCLFRTDASERRDVVLFLTSPVAKVYRDCKMDTNGMCRVHQNMLFWFWWPYGISWRFVKKHPASRWRRYVLLWNLCFLFVHFRVAVFIGKCNVICKLI